MNIEPNFIFHDQMGTFSIKVNQLIICKMSLKFGIWARINLSSSSFTYILVNRDDLRFTVLTNCPSFGKDLAVYHQCSKDKNIFIEQLITI